jgi:stage III sporulation protein AE
MKYKLLIIALFIFVAFGVGCVYAYADGGEELTDNLNDILQSIDLTDLQNYLDTHSDSFAFNFGNTASEIIEYLFSGNLQLNYSSYISELLNTIFKDLLSLVPSFAQVVAISILCAVVNSAEGGVVSKTTSKIIKLVCYSFIVLIITSMLYGVAKSAIECVNSIKAQVEIIMPILITLTVMTGGANSAAVYQPSALFLSSGAVEIVSGLIFPATIAIIVLDVLSKLNNEISFSGVTKLIKSILKWVLGITVTVFSIFLTVQSSASNLFDGIFFKATKYLVGSSVPIVGNFLSGGVDMIVSAGSVIKSSVGLLGIILLVSEIIQPIILLVGFSLMLKVVGAVVQPIGENTLYSLYSDLSSDIDYFIAGLLTVTFMYILTIMLMINSASSFI